MAVRIRMKQIGRKHRPFYRICAMDSRVPRGGRVIEELGTYDPYIRDVDARTTLDLERVGYWLGVGAQPTEKVSVLIKKYGPNGSRLEAATQAKAKLAQPKAIPPAPKPVPIPKKPEPAAEPAEAPAEEGAAAAAE